MHDRGDVEEMRSLLRYASNAKVARALGVSRASVSEWSRGNDVSPYRVDQVRALIVESLGQTKEAAPDIPGRLDEIEVLIRAIASVSGVDLPRVEAMRRELLAELRGPQPDATSRKAGPRGQGK